MRSCVNRAAARLSNVWRPVFTYGKYVPREPLLDCPMRAVIPLTLALACASLGQIRPASADTLRCGSALIEPGDDAGYVLEKCGEPNLRRGPKGSVSASASWVYYPAAALRADRWRYHRGIGKFPTVLIMGDDGRVAAIQLEKHRD
jgi:hypothetical protein